MAIRILAQRGVIVLPSGLSITPGMNVAKVVGDPVAWSAFQADGGGAAPTVQVQVRGRPFASSGLFKALTFSFLSFVFTAVSVKGFVPLRF
jgi:hypothetical protein